MRLELDPVSSSIAVGIAAASAAVSLQDYVAGFYLRFEEDIRDKLRRLRASTRYLRTYLIAWLIGTGCVFVFFWLFANSLIFALLSLVLLLAAPWYLLRRMAEKRKQKIEEQLADAMVTLANAVRAGLSLAQALEILATQCPEPIKSEFHQIVAEYNLGKPLPQTLTEAKERLRSENFALFAAALLASHESGGRLNETVERIAHSVLELQRLERKLMSETAQARKSAVYMALVPLLILPVYYFLDPPSTARLFTTVVGQFFLATAIVLVVVAYFWARLILNPDI